MCGILGVLDWNGKLPPRKEFAARVRELQDRGPDGQGVEQGAWYLLGHARLSIIDLSVRADQPMRRGDRTIVFNGEIYNYAELRDELKENGHQFTTTSDTEVVLAAYAEWGDRCVDRFEGMWALCIIDHRTREAFLARDPTGQKPLFYHSGKGRLVFGSRLSTVGGMCGANKLDREALVAYLAESFRHAPWDLTFRAGVKQLPPGHVMHCKKGRCRIAERFSPDFTVRPGAEKDYPAMIDRMVRATTVSDAPVGVLLSGGVDSATVCAHLPKDITAFTIAFSEKDTELLHARKIAKALGIRHETILLDKKRVEHELLDQLEELTESTGEPVALLQMAYTQIIAERVRKKGIKVLLSGNGGDELFYGYNTAHWLRLADTVVPGPLGKRIKPWMYRKRFDDAKALLADDAPTPSFPERFPVPDGVARSFYWYGLRVENEHSVTVVADRGGMSRGVEIRSPFLTQGMVRYSLQVPTRAKIGSLWNDADNKHLMREHLRTVLPASLADAPKKGFGWDLRVPELIRTAWKERFQTKLEFLEKSGLFKEGVLRALLDAHLAGDDHNALLVKCYTLACWLKSDSHLSIGVGR